ncbi:MAG: hypothetical protein JW808_09150 [Victivallales bacterium]|nr:hypothetical protein [Victivallales bacterium]
MNTRLSALSILLSFVAMVLLASCGGEKQSLQDTTPFENAVTAYLAEKNMDMKVVEFKKLDVADGKAEAECSMKHVSGIGPSVRWSFSFISEGDSWRVSSHSQ